MLILAFAILFAAPGGLAVVAGLLGMRRVRRLRRDGVAAWALSVTPPVPMDQQPGGSPRRALLQYTLADGRVIERITPANGRRSGLLRPGQRVLIWYDPQDPDDVLVYGRDSLALDRAFVIGGALVIGVGAVITGLGH
jgi:Protein of unknown function (DUF3592)/Mu transposase, C-terminal